MSGGGGTTKQVSEPWAPAQPFVLDSLRRAQSVLNAPPQFYPGASFAPPTAPELTAWDTRLGYADAVFGGARAPRFDSATSALEGALRGGSQGELVQPAIPAGQQALGRMLSGAPDYSGLQGAIEAANAPVLRDFEQRVLPGLNQRATFLNNETGGIKALNRVLPELGERMALNAQMLTEQERRRALDAQTQGLGMLGQFMSGASTDTGRALAMFPQMVQLGQLPGQVAQEAAQWGASFPQRAIADDMARWEFQQSQPQDLATWYSSLVNGTAGLGGTQYGRAPSNRGLGAMGGAMGGAQLGAMVGGPAGALPGALIGGLMGLF